MNPHFIFNSLNSIDYYIINNDQEKASDYLNRFSRLIRLILQNSKSTIVPLKDDLEALKLYIEMESLRFDNLFDYEVNAEKGLNLEKISVPPMIIQPYVENAIWHGLMQKRGEKGKLLLNIHQRNGHLLCSIEDNGIGREAAQQLKTKSATQRKSYGMKITSDRLAMLNKLAGTDASVNVIDLKNEDGSAAGTRVELSIPL
jgi:LytS/YehU family sensor histidine kinase